MLLDVNLCGFCDSPKIRYKSKYDSHACETCYKLTIENKQDWKLMWNLEKEK